MTPSLDGLDRSAAEWMGYSEPIEVGLGRSLKTADNWHWRYRVAPPGTDPSYFYKRAWLRDGTRLYCGNPFDPYRTPSPTRSWPDFGALLLALGERGHRPSVNWDARRGWNAAVWGPKDHVYPAQDADPRVALCLAVRALGGGR